MQFMRKYLLAILIILWAAVLLRAEQGAPLDEAFMLLKARKDNAALVAFEKILLTQPDNIDALWGKAEVLRRQYKFPEAENLLQQIFKINPRYNLALNTLAYIRYKDDKLGEALKLINQSLESPRLTKEDQATAYLMLGAINSRRSSKGWFLNKLIYGTQIRGYFEKAKALDPSLPEVHLGLGTFYLKAPAIAGGDLDKAIGELELAVKIAPDFATANARLAQAYKRKMDLEKYNFYIQRAKGLDPENEVLKE